VGYSGGILANSWGKLHFVRQFGKGTINDDSRRTEQTHASRVS
jgi:hypothetical protein